MSITLNTARFGELTIDEDKIILFPEGIPGFTELKRYILLDYKDTELKWLQAIDDGDVAFIVAPPWVVTKNYNITVDEKTKDLLELIDEKDLCILIILRVEGETVKANLAGPILINSSNKKAVQAIVDLDIFSKIL